jgi:hypothetical protein
MFLDSFFETEKTLIIDIQRFTQLIVKGVPQPKEWFSIKQVECLFFKGSMADRFVSDRMQVDISAVAIVNPIDIKESEIPSNGRLVIKNGADIEPMYSIVQADDIASQGEVISILLKAYT